MIELDPDRRLALAYVPARRRAAIAALWQLDLAFASVLVTGNDPMISRIRLAWWREALERLDHERPPAEPVLQALARDVLPLGVRGAELAGMEDGWSWLLTPDPLGPAELEAYAKGRGGLLFDLSARLLGRDAAPAGGSAWALIDLARNVSSPEEASSAIEAAARESVAARWPSPLRPLGMLAKLAAGDAAAGPGAWDERGAPRRMLQMLRHRLTGR